jgi:1,2-diacylglycerol 3-beta-galactosyltransferase
VRRPARILILTADYGSGHRSAARALDVALARAYGDAVRVEISNPIHHPSAPALLRRAESLYLDEVQQTPALYRLQYALTDLPLASLLLDSGARRMLRATMRHVLTESPADVAMSVFPFYSAAVAAAYSGAPTRPGLMTIVTDLGAVHYTWFTESDDYCAVSSEHARAKAIRSGMDPQRLHLTGIPAHPDFGAPRADQATLRRESGLREDLLTVLLLGGGAGIGQLDTFAYALDQAGLSVQLLIVAGRNAPLAEELRAHSWTIPVGIYEFVPLVDLMHVADVVATKAGGLTISEALAAGKPLLIHGVIPGQEEGNLRYIQEHGAGAWTPDPPALVAQIARWLAQPEELQRFTEAACRIGRPDAARQVAQLAWELAEAGPHPNALKAAPHVTRQLQDPVLQMPRSGAGTLPDLAPLVQTLMRQLDTLRQRLDVATEDQAALEANLQQLGPQAGAGWRRWLNQQRWLNQRQRQQAAAIERKLAQLPSGSDHSTAARSRAALERLSRQVEQLNDL